MAGPNHTVRGSIGGRHGQGVPRIERMYFTDAHEELRAQIRRFLEAETPAEFGDALARAFWLNGPGVLAAQLLAGQGPEKDESWGAWAARTLFFNLVLANTMEGFFADPIYGGNKDMVGWKLVGFPGVRYDFRDVIARPNQPYTRPPVSLQGRPEWNRAAG